MAINYLVMFYILIHFISPRNRERTTFIAIDFNHHSISNEISYSFHFLHVECCAQFRWYTDDSASIWYISVWSANSIYFKPCPISSACTVSAANFILELSIAASVTDHIFCTSAGRSSAWAHGLECRHDWILEYVILGAFSGWATFQFYQSREQHSSNSTTN